MVTFAIGCGIATMAAVSVYSLAGLSGPGRPLLFGVLADRLGAKPVLVGGLMVQALGAGAYLLSTSSASSMRCRSCSASPMAA